MSGVENATDAEIGGRLKKERERVGLTVVGFAEATGVSKSTQIKYEAGETSPAASYLVRALRLGVDVMFVMTGAQVSPSAGLTSEQSRLLDYFGAADDDAQRAAMLVLEALARLEPGSPQAQLATPGTTKRGWEVRPDIDLALWRTVALSLPSSVNAANVLMTPQQWLGVVDSVYENAKNDKAAREAAERGARSALARAQQK
jgi:transcriptional regulator with XRE-family HTH domain